MVALPSARVPAPVNIAGLVLVLFSASGPKPLLVVLGMALAEHVCSPDQVQATTTSNAAAKHVLHVAMATAQVKCTFSRIVDCFDCSRLFWFSTLAIYRLWDRGAARWTRLMGALGCEPVAVRGFDHGTKLPEKKFNIPTVGTTVLRLATVRGSYSCTTQQQTTLTAQENHLRNTGTEPRPLTRPRLQTHAHEAPLLGELFSTLHLCVLMKQGGGVGGSRQVSDIHQASSLMLTLTLTLMTAKASVSAVCVGLAWLGLAP